jgi:putative DNA primase/helicase
VSAEEILARRGIKPVPASAGGKHRLPPPGAIVSDPMPDEPWTELGYAHRLARVCRGRLRHVKTWNRWLVWDGKRWAHDLTGQAERWAKLNARRMTDIVLASDDPVFVRDHYPVARKSETSASVSSVLKLASTENEFATAHSALDADPFLLNCANGTLDLRTGTLRPHDPADLITKLARAAYDPEAPGTIFQAFLKDVQPDAGMRSFLARLIGHALEGRVTEHILPIFHGEGANGKSTYINAVEYALGDYAAPADPELLTARTFDAHPTGTADLFGLRLAILHETDRGRRLAEGTVKRLTGGDAVKARRMREDFWSFDPSHTFFMLTNHKPLISGTDEGIWRRIRLVPWNFVVPADQRDEHLGDKLALEADYVLTWLVRGCAEWQQTGLVDPEAVTTATEAYKTDSDAVGRFLGECCTKQQAGVSVGSTELFRAWEKWCAGESEEPGSHKAFSTELENRGYAKTATRTGVRWDRLGLLTDREEGQ